MRDRVHRRQIRLQAAAAELGEVGVLREAENPLQDCGEHALGEDLLVVSERTECEVGTEDQMHPRNSR